MPFDESPQVNQENATWPEIDRRLIDREGREALPSFPLHLLPERFRAWVEAQAVSFTPVDYLAQGLLAAVSSVCSGAISARVSAGWSEPLVLWQALVGSPSTGKTPALAAARRLLDGLESMLELKNENFLHVMVSGTMNGEGRGAVLWRDDLASWLEPASLGTNRADWLAGWNAREADSRPSAHLRVSSQRFALTVVGALRPDRLADSLADEELAARLLYAWPEATHCAPLGGPIPDGEGVRGLLTSIASLAGSVADPYWLPLGEEAVRTFEHLLPALRQEMRESDGAEAAWLGKGAGTIVRLAGLLTLLRWAESAADWPGDIDAAALLDAHALWSGYFLPHARAIFGQAGSVGRDRLARRATRWLRRARLSQVSREDIRRDALARSLDAEGTDEIIERLEQGGVLRTTPTQATGGRRPRRWEVNPALL
ncbi:MAG TPA: DUF3987 domain-containing protein [Reyranella sp.]|nr:DUF3987 domain-containing protein [Reyranella sp.]